MHPLVTLPYRALASAAAGLARLPLPGESKVIRTLRARRGAVDRFIAWSDDGRDPGRPLLWMHAPSVGEGLQARPVLDLLRTRRPDLQVVYTFFSPSAERFAAALDVEFADCLPFDTASAAERLLDALRPDAIVFSKLDLWPVLAERAHRRGVRLGMIAATLAAGSGRRGALARAVLGDAYAALDAVGAIAAEDAERLGALGVAADRLIVTGDTRYDQVRARATAVDRSSALLTSLATERPTLVAGSTWPADERHLLPAWLEVRQEVPGARLIIAPHEPTAAHLEPLARWAHDAGFRVASLGNADASHDVVVVDRVGVLGELYALGTAAFVGGGFHSAGLHSVLEPAAYGMPVLFGPRFGKSRDAGLLIECQGGVAVRDAEELSRALRIVLTEGDTRARAGRAALALVERGAGASARSVELILERLLPQRREGRGEA